MTALAEPAAAQRGTISPKREQVLDAAEICFIRSGFHRATMQDIAREAAMSPANIYRYFESKESVVLGLADRERERGGVILRAFEQADDRQGTLLGLIRQFFAELTREHAVLQIEIWAEASRNQPIAEMVARGEAEHRAWFVETLTSLARGPDCDAAALYERVHPLMKGIIVSRALIAGYDAAPAVAELCATLAGGLAGTFSPASGDVKDVTR